MSTHATPSRTTTPTTPYYLDAYQRDNLRALLTIAESMSGLNTGDWVRELLWKLGDEVGHPNVTPERQREVLIATLSREATR